MIEFLKSIGEYTTEADKQRLERFIESDKSDWYSFKKEVDIFQIVGDSFYGNGVLEAFGSTADENLSNSKTSKFVRKTILANQIRYYQLIGVYKDQMPVEEFLLSPEAIANMPPRQFIDDMITKKEHFGKLAREEHLKITSSYQENSDKIKSLGLVSKIDFEVDIIEMGATCITPNARIVNGNLDSLALLFFSSGCCPLEFIDTFFIHEINHAVELCLIDCVDGKGTYKCGFEIISDDENAVRDYEGFSEIINQMIAIEITEAMHRDGVYLFDNPKTSKTRGGTSYEQQRIFTGVFFEKFKKIVMQARTQSNLDSLFYVVGKENFEALNGVINEYRALPYYAMMDDVIAQRTTKLTEKRMELINRSVEILDVMIERAKQIPGYENLVGRKV